MLLKKAWIPAGVYPVLDTGPESRQADSSPQAAPIGQQVSGDLTMEIAKPWPKRERIQSPLIISPSNLDRIDL